MTDSKVSFSSKDKQEIVERLMAKVNEGLKAAKDAFSTAKDHASGDEMKAEGKHDTRGIEAGYIAGAQKKRVDELEQELKLLEEINVNHETTEVSVGSLVALAYNKMTRYYFISSSAGGTMLTLGDQTVLVISAFSPIGREVIGLKVHDIFEIEHGNENREYELLEIF